MDKTKVIDTLNLICCAVALCILMSSVALADDWFTDNPQEQCTKIKHESLCDCPSSELTPVTGGQYNVKFFETSETDPYAAYNYGPSGYCPRSDQTCVYFVFTIEGKQLSCEDFYVSLQAKQKSCHGCLDTKSESPN